MDCAWSRIRFWWPCKVVSFQTSRDLWPKVIYDASYDFKSSSNASKIKWPVSRDLFRRCENPSLSVGMQVLDHAPIRSQASCIMSKFCTKVEIVSLACLYCAARLFKLLATLPHCTARLIEPSISPTMVTGSTVRITQRSSWRRCLIPRIIYAICVSAAIH